MEAYHLDDARRSQIAALKNDICAAWLSLGTRDLPVYNWSAETIMDKLGHMCAATYQYSSDYGVTDSFRLG